jgi:predicted DNA-binding transcriptional regulator YafY
MATNKHAQIRYKVLDSCFKNTGRDYTFEDLIDAINDALAEIDPSADGISVRTVREDIAFMESELGWSAEIDRVRFGKKCIYRYKNSDFSINNQPLNQSELSQISSALEIIGRFEGMPQFELVNSVLTKINNGIEIKNDKDSIISFDHNEYLKGIEHLGNLFNSINSRKVIKVIYHPFKANEDIEIILHPYYLKQFNNRWFLLGLNDELKKIYNIALDRIVSFETISKKYIKNTDIDFKEYFEDVIGVTKPEKGKAVKVELQFNKEAGPYVFTKPLHGSQHNKKIDENGLLITIEIIPNIEFEKLILSFGDQVKIISPKKIVDLFKSKYKNALSQYGT